LKGDEILPLLKILIMKKVKFIVKGLSFAKGEEREVTDRAAEQYLRAGIVEPFEVKEEKEAVETKEEKAPIETKEEKKPKAKITKSPR